MAKVKDRGMGRPTKLNKETQSAVVTAVGLGATYELASLYAGLNRDTVYEWINRGEREGKGPFKEFSDAVKNAEGKGLVGCLAQVRGAASAQWQAAAWMLERRRPQDYGRIIQRVEHTGSDGQPLPEPKTTVNIQVNFAEVVDSLKGLSVDELRLLHRLANRPDEAGQEALSQGDGNGAVKQELQ